MMYLKSRLRIRYCVTFPDIISYDVLIFKKSGGIMNK